MENVGDDSANVSRRKHRVFDLPCSRFQTKSWSYGGLTVVLRWSYDSSHGKTPRTFHLWRYKKGAWNIGHGEVLPTENTKGTKTRIPMKLDDKSQQITQISQIIIDKRKSSNETNETNKRNHRIRRNAQKYIMAQVRDKKKFLRLSALSAVKKTTEDVKDTKNSCNSCH